MDLRFVRHTVLIKKIVQYIRKRLLGSSGYRLWDSIKMYLMEKDSENMIWNKLF
jgi:hypothetical protein